MAYLDLLIQECTIQEDIGGIAYGYGGVVEDWQTYLTEDCRLQTVTGREVVVGAEVVIAEYKLFLGDVDVTEQHRVIVDTVTYQILLVLNRQNGFGAHHKECLLRVVR